MWLKYTDEKWFPQAKSISKDPDAMAYILYDYINETKRMLWWLWDNSNQLWKMLNWAIDNLEIYVLKELEKWWRNIADVFKEWRLFEMLFGVDSWLKIIQDKVEQLWKLVSKTPEELEKSTRMLEEMIWAKKWSLSINRLKVIMENIWWTSQLNWMNRFLTMNFWTSTTWKIFSKTAKVARKSWAMWANAMYSALAQVPSYTYFVQTMLKKYGDIDWAYEIWNLIWFKSAQLDWRDISVDWLWLSQTDHPLKAIMWITSIKKWQTFLSNNPNFFWELADWLNNITDIIYRPYMRDISLLQAIQTNWARNFQSMEEFWQWVKTHPESAVKKKIIDIIRSKAQDLFKVYTWFDYWLLWRWRNNTLMSYYGQLTNFRWGRWLNKAKYIINSFAWGASNFIKDVNTKWVWRKWAKENLAKYLMANDEISNIIEMWLRSAYYGTKLSRWREDEDRDSAAWAIWSTLDAMAYFNMDVQSLNTFSLWRMLRAGIDWYAKHHTMWDVWRRMYESFRRDLLRQYKPLWVISWALWKKTAWVPMSEILEWIVKDRRYMTSWTFRYYSDWVDNAYWLDYIPEWRWTQWNYFYGQNVSKFKEMKYNFSSQANKLQFMSLFWEDSQPWALKDWLVKNFFDTLPVIKDFLQWAKWTKSQIENVYKTINDDVLIKQYAETWKIDLSSIVPDQAYYNYKMSWVPAASTEIQKMYDLRDSVAKSIEQFMWFWRNTWVGKWQMVEQLKKFSAEWKSDSQLIDVFIKALDGWDLEWLQAKLMTTRWSTMEKTVEVMQLLDAWNIPWSSYHLLWYLMDAEKDLITKQYKKASGNKTLTQWEEDLILDKTISALGSYVWIVNKPLWDSIVSNYVLNKYPEEMGEFTKIEQDSQWKDYVTFKWLYGKVMSLYLTAMWSYANWDAGGWKIMNQFQNIWLTLPSEVRWPLVVKLMEEIDKLPMNVQDKMHFKVDLLRWNPELIEQIDLFQSAQPEVASEFIRHTYWTLERLQDMWMAYAHYAAGNENGTSWVRSSKASYEKFKPIYDSMQAKIEKNSDTFNSLNIKPYEPSRWYLEWFSKPQRQYVTGVGKARDSIAASESFMKWSKWGTTSGIWKLKYSSSKPKSTRKSGGTKSKKTRKVSTTRKSKIKW
jgi:hypothetical protein